MSRAFRLSLTCLGLAAVTATAATNAPAPARIGLVWRQGSGRHDANLDGWPLERVLNRLSQQTGWRVLMEPGTRTRVRTRFTGLPSREALPLLLGGLNFTLTTPSNSPTTLRVFRSSPSAARDRLVGEHEDELILRLKEGAPRSAAELAKDQGGRVTGTNGTAFRLEFESASRAEAARKRLEEDTSVASVETNLDLFPPDAAVPVDGPAQPPLGLQATVNPDGSQRVIALVDTAVQPLSAEYQALMLPSVDIVPGAVPTTEPTHGTGMAEAMAHGLSAASADGRTTTRIRSYDVYGAGESTSAWDVAVGVTRAVNDGATIINLSLGGSQESPYLRDVLGSVASQGALVVAAAGNDGSANPFYPAAYDSTLAVTASTAAGGLAAYANRGSFVDVAAPGATLVTLSGGAWRVQGTSVSAAYVSGVAGALGQDPSISLGSVRQSLGTAFPVPGATRSP